MKISGFRIQGMSGVPNAFPGSAAISILGYGNAGEVLGRDPAMILEYPDGSPKARSLLQCGEPGTDRIACEAVVRRKDGSTFVMVALYVINDGRADAELTAAVKAGAAGRCVVQPEGKILSVNPRVADEVMSSHGSSARH